VTISTGQSGGDRRSALLQLMATCLQVDALDMFVSLVLLTPACWVSRLHGQ
jgi:hypothetical protein